jgi:hypothetical protein
MHSILPEHSSGSRSASLPLSPSSHCRCLPALAVRQSAVFEQVQKEQEVSQFSGQLLQLIPAAIIRLLCSSLIRRRSVLRPCRSCLLSRAV